jgi:2-oxoglutarate dehydrogenase complex dehydrogenase (E1) component-like enzyme
MWCQEEPKNFGAWYYAFPRLINMMKHAKRQPGDLPIYAGRDPSAASSTGHYKIHE